MSKRPGDEGYAAGWCIHYRYNREAKSPETDTCEAGVRYDQFKQSKFAVRPCFLDDKGQSKPDALPCEHLRRPTTKEIALHEKWLKTHFRKMAIVMLGIAEWRKSHKGKSASEVVECPICKGRLHLSIATYNDHVHGRCETPDCVSWME